MKYIRTKSMERGAAMTKEEYEKLELGQPVTMNDYVLTNINLERKCYAIRLTDECEYIVHYTLKPKQYFIVIGNTKRFLDKDVVKEYKRDVREYEKYGI